MATDTGKNKKTRKGWKVFLSLIVVLVLSVLGVIEWQPEIFHELLQYYYAQQTEIPTQEEIAIPTESIPVECELELHMIDVGQGDSILLRQDQHAMLVDCGTRGKGDAVVSYLQQLGITYLDVLVGTHPHDDHMGGMEKVIRAFYDKEAEESKIGVLYAPDNSEDDITAQWYENFLQAVLDTNLKWDEPEVGKKFTLGGAMVQILAPNSKQYDNKNNYSIGLRISFGETDIILTGDAEQLAEQEMIQTGLPLDAEIMKAGHHGSDTSNSEEFLDAVNPSYMLISAGLGNRYDHPIQSVMERLEEREITVYRTDECGTVIMTTDGKQIHWNVSPGDYLSGEECKQR